MFNQLSDRLNNIFRNLKGKGKISESNIQDSLKEIKLALLEADVNFKIVKNFISEVQKRAIGQEVLRSIEPGQQVVKIVHEQLISLMQTDDAPINFQSNRINKIMLVGLQGSGKTTCCAKLAQFYRKKGIKPLLVACDVYRPAAAQQLSILGKQLDIPVYVDNESKDVNYIAKKAMEFADKELCNLMIFDTAGRLHIDEKLMKEVKDLKDYTDPDYIFFVADAVTGQDAVNVAKEFNELLEFNGVILTKMDGDARGGAALSIRAVTNKPILYIGVGEKISDLEEFHADRMASRILGMGDILSLIEKAQETFDQEQAEKLATKLKKNEFSFQDFLLQLQQLKKMGPLDQIIGMLPGVGNMKAMKDFKVDDKELKRVEAIIFSMTTYEREKPEVINGSRRMRIAKGSGTSVQEVNRLLKQFEQMRKMIKSMNNPSMLKKMGMPF